MAPKKIDNVRAWATALLNKDRTYKLKPENIESVKVVTLFSDGLGLNGFGAVVVGFERKSGRGMVNDHTVIDIVEFGEEGLDLLNLFERRK